VVLSVKKLVVKEGIEMKDKTTGDEYCVEISNGEFVKTKGACGTQSTQVPTQSASVFVPVVTPEVQTPPVVTTTTATGSPEIILETPTTSTDPIVPEVVAAGTPLIEPIVIDPVLAVPTVVPEIVVPVVPAIDSTPTEPISDPEPAPVPEPITLPTE